jgi:protein-tyrosine kinase
MSLIEQATKRLEELSQAGIALPWGPAGAKRLGVADTAVAGNVHVVGVAAAPLHIAKTSPVPRTSKEVELDLDRLLAAGFLVPAVVRSEMAAEFRLIKRPLLKSAQASADGQPGRNNLIMVTSALAGEGKTFCAINLALSIAMEVDSSVLLVDADVSRPSVLRALGLEPAPGLLDVLRDPSRDLADLILKTNVPKLSLFPAGTADGRSTELLASAAMERLLDELATRYPDRIVVLDAPPLLLTTESRVLAANVGQILMVVESSRTPQAKVAQAFATVERCAQVTTLLNKCPKSVVGDSYYGY